MNKKKLYKELSEKNSNLNFKKFCRIIENFGFKYKGTKGSHFIYTRENVIELVNVQNVQGKAKPYQVKQFIKIIKKYNLLMED